jgi:hypothetical protein
MGTVEKRKISFRAKNRTTTVQPVGRDCTEGDRGLDEDFTKLKEHHYVQFEEK